MDVRRIDFEEAELVIHAGGDWRGFRSAACAKEPETARWIRNIAGPGSVFFDIGACVGSYSLIAAALGATVHAFEPVARNYAELQLNVWLNNSQNIAAWPVALTATTGPLKIELSTTTTGAASHTVKGACGSTDLTSMKASQAALGMPLDRFTDDFLLPQPTDLKIDVDGGEIAILEGAREILSRARSVMIEVTPESAPSAAAILLAAGLEQTGSWPRTGSQSNHLYERIISQFGPHSL